MLDTGELCDDGAANTGGYGKCKMDCTPDQRCGDGIKNGPEACDLGGGNEMSHYGMGKTSFGEQCDGGAMCSAMCKLVPID